MKHLLLGSAVSLLLATVAANAVEKNRYDYQGAGGPCRAASAAYAASLRVRPLGMANETAGDAFITCSWQGDDVVPARGAWRLAVNAGNADAAARTVTCTLVNAGSATPTYTVKSVALAPGAGGFIAWVPADVPGAPAQLTKPSVSCHLPSNTVLHYIGRHYAEDIGV